MSAYPLPGQSIYVATIEELQRVYARPDKATIKVGSVSQAQEIPVHLMLDDLVGKHFAVLGTTGSGKSCAVTLLLQRMIEEYPHAHVVLLDPHNEYPPAFGEHAELVDPTTMDIPHWLLNFEETIELFVGQSHEAPIAETNILKVALLDARKAVTQLQVDKSKVTVDTPMPYKLGDLIKQIYVRVELPDIVLLPGAGTTNAVWSNSITESLVEYAELVIGGQTIQRITGEYGYLQSELRTSESLYPALQEISNRKLP
ncbi:MAG: DUF87 domain-containing protein, partial [Candidatus Hydrogenedentota bacterium]